MPACGTKPLSKHLLSKVPLLGCCNDNVVLVQAGQMSKLDILKAAQINLALKTVKKVDCAAYSLSVSGQDCFVTRKNFFFSDE